MRPLDDSCRSSAQKTATVTAATIEATSTTRRGISQARPTSSAAVIIGTAMASGASSATFAPRAQLLRVERAVALVRLDGQCQQQRRDRYAHHHVGERERLDDRVDGPRAHRHRVEDRGDRVVLVADREQHQVRRRLHHREAHHEVDEVAAGYDAVQPDDHDPRGYGIGEEAHGPFRLRPPGLPRRTSVCCRNSDSMKAKPPVTASPTARLLNGIRPAESSWPGVPLPSTFAKNAVPNTRPARPISTKLIAPAPSAASITCVGPTRRMVR